MLNQFGSMTQTKAQIAKGKQCLFNSHSESKLMQTSEATLLTESICQWAAAAAAAVQKARVGESRYT